MLVCNDYGDFVAEFEVNEEKRVLSVTIRATADGRPITSDTMHTVASHLALVEALKGVPFINEAEIRA